MTPSRQGGETRSVAKRSWILDKAGAIFWQKGYDGTSMRDIANACHCKPANIYNYFQGKEDILFEVIRDITEKAVASVRHLEDDDATSPVEQLKSLVKNHFGLLVAMKRSNVLVSDSALKDLSSEHRKTIIGLRDRYDAILRDVIARGIASGDFAVKDEEIVTYLIASVILRSTIWFSPKGRLSAGEVGELMFDFIYRGIKA